MGRKVVMLVSGSSAIVAKALDASEPDHTEKRVQTRSGKTRLGDVSSGWWGGWHRGSAKSAGLPTWPLLHAHLVSHLRKTSE